MNNPNVFVGLVHHPVYNKGGETITTSITNLDLHDISRTSTTFGVNKYFIINHVEPQQLLIKDILNFWLEGHGSTYNPDRKEALERVFLAKDLAEVMAEIQKITGKKPITVATDARVYPNTIGYRQLREKIHTVEEPYLILFGTGFGIIKEVMEEMDYILEPILGAGEYNHLSVRSAVAIIMDRLLGESWWA